MGVELFWIRKVVPYRAHGFIGQDNAAFGRELRDVPIAQTAATGAPDAVADNLRRKPMALVRIGGGSCVHVARMPDEVGAGTWRFMRQSRGWTSLAGRGMVGPRGGAEPGDVLIRAPAGGAAKFLDVKLGQYHRTVRPAAHAR